mgnify:CR=1 FL=1
MDDLFKDHKMGFQERCCRYKTHVFDLEACLLMEYKIWCFNIRSKAKRGGEVGFYGLLAMEFDHEHDEVQEEYLPSLAQHSRPRRARRMQNTEADVAVSASDQWEN